MLFSHKWLAIGIRDNNQVGRLDKRDDFVLSLMREIVHFMIHRSMKGRENHPADIHQFFLLTRQNM